MKITRRTETVHEVTIANLELVPSTDRIWTHLRRDSSLDNPNSVLDEEEFADNWLSEVLYVACQYRELQEARFYLGHLNEDNKPQVVVIEPNLHNAHSRRNVIYNGWRVTVNMHQVSWGPVQ